MPLYDMECQRCDDVTEVMSSIGRRNEHVCNHCGEHLRVVVRPVALAGIIWSNAALMSDGSVVSSNKELREHNLRTGTEPISHSDSLWQNKKYECEEQSSRVAVKLGYTDHEHMRREVRFRKDTDA